MKKCFIAILLSTILIILFSGIAFSQSNMIDPGGIFKLTLSVGLNAESAFVLGMRQFAEELEKVSGGKVTLEIFPDSTLFSDVASVGAVRSGEIEMAAGTPGNLMDISPWFGMLDMPYNFDSYDHMVRFYESQHGKEVFDRILKEQGVRIFTYQLFGIRQTYLRDIGKIVRSPEDMKGISLRTPATPIMMAIGFGLGANPTPIDAWEAFSALLTGAIDGIENPLPFMYSVKIYESCKYVLPTNHMFNVVFPMINENVYQQMTPEFQEYFYEGVTKWMRWADDYTFKQDEEAEKGLKEHGMIFVDDIDIEVFKESCNDYVFNKSGLTEKWDMKLYEIVQSLR